MKHMTIEMPRVPPRWRLTLRWALTTLLAVLLIAGLIWLIGSIHMNAGSWLGVLGLLFSMVMLIDMWIG